MTARIEKTVFISYRRTNFPWALAIYQDLTHHGYDVFFDYQSINSGDFEQVIIGNIRARAYFLCLLTPSSLERCNEPNDWLRREIELALEERRNIVPLFLEGFNFASPSITQYLTGRIADLKRYNGLTVPADYFIEAMERLRQRYLNTPLDIILHPVSNTIQKIVDEQQLAANGATQVNHNDLSAQELYEQGKKEYFSREYDKAILTLTSAINLKADYSEAYNGRGVARKAKGDLAGAIKDYDEAIRIQPDLAKAYNNRGILRYTEGNLVEAIKDLTMVILLKPDFTDVYKYRGRARAENGNLDGAINDFDSALNLDPFDAELYYDRGITHAKRGDLDKAIKDYTESIHLNPKNVDVYWARGSALYNKGDYHSAITNYQTYFDLGGKNELVRQYLNDAKMRIGGYKV